jgi:hypothetical protein
VSAEKGPERQYRDFEFNLRELAGSMGDFGTLFPLAIGYIAINGLNPAGLFIMLGLTNIALGLVYRLPMPLQPKKVVAVTAIAQEWSPSLIYASGFGLGLLWLVVALTGLLRKLVEITPTFIVRGIQLALGVTLAWQAVRWMLPAPLLGLAAIAIVVLLRENRYAPAAIVIVVLGIVIMAWQGDLPEKWELTLRLPPLTVPRLKDVWQAMLLAGFAQIPLSITNAVIAPAALIRDYFPEKAVTERKLMLNMGVMNVVTSFFGGMPMCHGAGGLAGQYYFGAHGRHADPRVPDRGRHWPPAEHFHRQPDGRLSDAVDCRDATPGRYRASQARDQAARVQAGIGGGHCGRVGCQQHGHRLCGRSGRGPPGAAAEVAMSVALSVQAEGKGGAECLIL